MSRAHTSGSVALDLARLPQRWALAPRVFVPLQPGRARGSLDVEFRVGDLEIRVSGPEALGVNDQDVLIALLRLAERDTCELPPVPVTPAGVRLRSALKAKGGMASQVTVAVETTMTKTAMTIGRSTGGKALQDIKASLVRLGGTTVILDGPGGWGEAKLLAWSADGDPGAVVCAIHPDIAQCLVHKRVATTYVDLNDYRSLKSRVARRLFVRLCGYVDRGPHGRLNGADTLVRALWPESASVDTTRQRRASVRDALGEIANLADWEVEFLGDQARISRRYPEGTK